MILSVPWNESNAYFVGRDGEASKTVNNRIDQLIISHIYKYTEYSWSSKSSTPSNSLGTLGTGYNSAKGKGWTTNEATNSRTEDERRQR